MGATLKYGEWDFGPQMHYSKGGECHSTGGTVKKAMGGACGYKEGGTVKKQMGGPLVSGPANVAPGKASKGGKVASKMCKAEGGILEKATGERYASKKEMMKHEKGETPREQRQEMTKGKIPVRKSVPVASKSPLIAMKKGGKCYAEGGKVNTEIAKANEGNKARNAIANMAAMDKANADRRARQQVQNMPSNANLQMAPSRNPATTNMNNPNTRQMDADKAYTMSMAAPVDYGNQMNQMRSSYAPFPPDPRGTGLASPSASQDSTPFDPATMGRGGVDNYPGSAVGRSSYAPQAPTVQYEYGKGGKVAPSKKK